MSSRRNPGWRNEPVRHSLAAKGVGTTASPKDVIETKDISMDDIYKSDIGEPWVKRKTRKEDGKYYWKVTHLSKRSVDLITELDSGGPYDSVEKCEEEAKRRHYDYLLNYANHQVIRDENNGDLLFKSREYENLYKELKEKTEEHNNRRRNNDIFWSVKRVGNGLPTCQIEISHQPGGDCTVAQTFSTYHVHNLDELESHLSQHMRSV